jgi:nucleotide-binding universal stress UspA family protein
VSIIVIGVDATERSGDAIVLGRRLAEASGANVLVANAFPYSDFPSRAANASYRQSLAAEAKETARAMRERLDLPEGRSQIRVIANQSPAHALHDLASAEHASLLIVGSTHTGSAGRVLPGSTGERLLHGSACAVCVVPKDYRDEPIRRIGVAYDATEEARAAVNAAADLARALGAELEVVGVVSEEWYGTPALIGAPNPVVLRQVMERCVQESLDEVTADIDAKPVRLTGGAADMLTAYSEHLDLLIMGSRGYGPLRSVLVGGVSGRVMRSAHCPVIVVPRGIEAPLGSLFAEAIEAA